MPWVLGRKLLISLLKQYSWRHTAQVPLRMNSQDLEGRGRFSVFITSERGCLTRHLCVLGVEAGLSGCGHAFCSVREEPLCSFQYVT